MEKIKVNMSPNPLDVQTIHASQNDGEARQWEFELHNNGELIDTSEITEQMVFKSYKGGTEEILPENGSTPTTSPFKGDIRYPQGLLTDQEFTYRESPTESDGLAKITDIKGNTLNWNQLVQNGNFADGTNRWTVSNPSDSISVSDNTLSFHTDVVYGAVSTALPIDVNNHVLLVKAQVRTQGNRGIVRAKMTNNFGYTNSNFAFPIEQVNVWTDVLMYGRYTTTPEGSTESPRIGFQDYRNIGSSNLIEVKNVQVFDLTIMGLDISSTSEFTSLFPLSYYSYNQGTLLSFNGTGLKTTGKNILVNSGFVRGVLGWNNSPSDSNIVTNNAYITSPFIPIPQGVSQITLSAIKGSIVRYWEADSNFNGLYFGGNKPDEGQTITRTLSAGCRYIRISIGKDGLSILPSYYGTVVYGQIEFGNQASNYEPYTSSTLSLPISTYFPTGMKSAGNVYDELTESKAITRIGSVDLGSLTWQYYPERNNFYAVIPDITVPTNANTKTNAKCILGVPITWNEMRANQNESGTYAVTQVDTEKRFYIKNTNYSSITDFMTFINGVYLYYELATPTETLITTASLVTENAEIPLSNNDGVLIGKCTEELSAEPGFHDAKIKLSDGDGTCYSNKIQLHVERKPS